MIIRRCFKILGELFYTKSFETYKHLSPSNQKSIFCSLQQYSIPIKLEIEGREVMIFLYSDKKLYAEMNVAYHENLYKYLIDKSISRNEEFEEVLSVLDSASVKFLETAKYLFGYSGIEENILQLQKTLLFVNNKWEDCFDKRQTVWLYSDPYYVVDDSTITTISDLINHGIEYFYGLKFLHKAKNEQNLRDKWIYTAMAVELGAKEFLFIKDPSLKKNWNKSGGPKLEDLFNEYLAKMVSNRLPFIDKLITNAKIRNDIIHRPFERNGLNYKNAMEYLDFAENFIFSLMLEIYPNNPVLIKCLQNIKNDMTAEK